jgi:hypothetical protein
VRAATACSAQRSARTDCCCNCKRGAALSSVQRVFQCKLRAGTYGEAFFGTRRYGAATFGKYANFTKQMGDYSKDPLASAE